MPLATIHIYVDWNNDGDFSDPNECIDSYVMEISTERGRNNVLANSMVGTAELLVNNNDKRFSPQNTASPLYPNLVDGRKVKITATHIALYEVFNGYISSIRPHPDLRRKDCYIYATGTLGRLKTDVETYLFGNATEATILAYIIDEVEKPGETIPRSFDGGLDTYAYAWWLDEEALDAAFDVVRSAVGLLYERADGYLIYENRNHRTAHTVAWTCDNAMSGLELDYDTKCIINRATTLATNREGDDDLWEVYSLPEIIYIDASETRRFVAVLTNPYTQLDTPIAYTDYEFNSQADGEGDDLTANLIITKEAPLKAQTCNIKIINTVATAGYLIAFGLQGRLLVATEMSRHKDEDTTSIDAHGLYLDEYDGGFISSIDKALTRSELIIDRYAEPTDHLTITLKPGTSDKLTQMLAREISDKIHIEEDDSCIDASYYIEKIKHYITPGSHVVTWLCSEVPPLGLVLTDGIKLGDTASINYS